MTIEFPAVLINLKTRVIEAEFHTYIRPVELPSLSTFCTSFTGVTQEAVNNGVLLADALRMFNDWVNDFYFEKGLILIDDGHRKQNTVLITWTDLDLGVYLPGECQRKGIERPPYFAKWIDLRDLYSVSAIQSLRNSLDNFYSISVLLFFVIAAMDRHRSHHLIFIRIKNGGHSIHRSTTFGSRRFTQFSTSGQQNDEGRRRIVNKQQLWLSVFVLSLTVIGIVHTK